MQPQFSPYRNIAQYVLEHVKPSRHSIEHVLSYKRLQTLSKKASMDYDFEYDRKNYKGHDAPYAMGFSDFGIKHRNTYWLANSVFVNLVTSENYLFWRDEFNSYLYNGFFKFNEEVYGEDILFILFINTISELGIKLPLCKNLYNLYESQAQIQPPSSGVEYEKAKGRSVDVRLYSKLLDYAAKNTNEIYAHLDYRAGHAAFEGVGFMPLKGLSQSELEQISVLPQKIRSVFNGGDWLGKEEL